MKTREDLLSELNNSEYYLAEAEMYYDRTGDEDAADAIRFWASDVKRIEKKLEEL